MAVSQKIRVPIPFATGDSIGEQTEREILDSAIHTVCREASCPNFGICRKNGSAAFMILGNLCTRNCRFCNVETGKPFPPNPEEPVLLAELVKKMGLRHAVITSVTRDDLPDGGSMHYKKTIEAIKKINPNTLVEVLIPDFKGNESSLETVLSAGPDIINHNLETVPSLYPEICPQANYENSLKVLRLSYRNGFPVKSGLMVGLGETQKEVIGAFKDLQNNGVSILTIGQYLRPSSGNVPVREIFPESYFQELKETALSLGFRYVFSGSLVRSSFMAEEVFREFLGNKSRS